MKPPARWRFLSLASYDGLTNMAIDEAMLDAHIAGLVPPTLRLYRFDPPAVSLGHTQPVPAGLSERASERGCQVVRRPTGGRAVLHLDDLTYSFVATTVGAGGFLSESVTQAYKQICRGLQCALARLGLPVELGAASAAYKQMHDCFLATTGSDLHWQGRKIVGSAQLRRKGGVLQHGSVLLKQDQHVITQLLGEGAGGPRKAIHHANLFHALGREVSFDELSKAMREGFAEAFEIDFDVSELNEFERERTRGAGGDLRER